MIQKLTSQIKNDLNTHLYIYRQAERSDHHFSPPINNSLKSLKLGKILKIY